MESIWKQEVEIEERETLGKNMRVETIVIGAGLTGLLTAYFLQKQGQQVVVLEADRIASGQTRNTTAKITSQHGLFYDKLIRNVDRDKAQAYVQAQEEAIQSYGKLIEEEHISCHFERRPAYLYTIHEEKKQKLEKEAKAAEELGIKARFLQGEEIRELPFKVSAAVCFENQAQFHPLEFIKQLAEECTVYENTKVIKVKGRMVYTSQGNILAENIVFATHYPFLIMPGFYFLRQHQERSYCLALEGQKELEGMYYSADKDGLSFRSAGDTLILGGGSHRTGKYKSKAGTRDVGYGFLRKMKEKYYPTAKEIAAWSAQDCMPHDDIPFIGCYSIFRPYWFVATGFKKWGMTAAMVAAKELCRQITTGMSLYDDVFSPQRLLLRASFKNLLIDIGESMMGLAMGLFCKNDRRCTHMGCRLEWNAEENMWECPCHGSRFNGAGELKDNPARKDLASGSLKKAGE